MIFHENRMSRIFKYFKKLLPLSFKKTFWGVVEFIRCQTLGRISVLPDFIIVGAQKCGTTSLYNYLIRHPNVYASSKKEIGFFNVRYSKGVNWYRAHFPTSLKYFWINKIRKKPFLTGEADPEYIINPYALKRIAKLLPDCKLILILRNPVDRAYSHYQHACRFKRGRETLSFDEAIEKEQERIGEAWQKMLKDENYQNRNIPRYSYLTTGVYIDQVQVLLSLFNKEQLLFLNAEDFFDNTEQVFKQVVSFLGLPNWTPAAFKKHNSCKYANLNSELRDKLNQYYRLPNTKLYKLLGINFNWEV